MSNVAKASSKRYWIKDTFQFTEDFIKSYNEEGDEGYFLEVDVQYLEKSGADPALQTEFVEFFV